MADAVRVTFAGEGSGEEELSWGQKTAWRGVLAKGCAIWLTGIFDIPPGRTVEDIAGDMSFLMGRHEALRTRLIVSGPDDVRQVVSSSGETELDVIDVDDDGDPRQVAKDLEETYNNRDRDWAGEWPFRMTVIRHRGVPVLELMAFDHTSADGFTLFPVMVDRQSRDPVTGAAAGPVIAPTPREIAAWQISEAGQRASARAERYWDRTLRAMPRTRFPESDVPGDPQYWEVRYSSPALFLALQVVADRTGHDTSPVLLAAFAVGLATASGINPAVPRLMVNNRFRRGLADSVGPLSQTAPCSIDVAGITFDEAVGRAYQSSLAAYKNAYFEPVRIREIVAAVSAERGPLDVDMLYNDRRSTAAPGETGESAGMGRGVTGPLATPDQIRAALPLTTIEWEQHENPMDEFHLHAEGAEETLRLLLRIDTHYVSRADLEALLERMESVTVESAIDPETMTGV